MTEFASKSVREERYQSLFRSLSNIVLPAWLGVSNYVNDDQLKRARNLAEYGNKPKLEVLESNEYTHWTAWAHTEPERHVINIRPSESIDYRLGVLPHEIVHNFYPLLRNEDHVTQICNGPLFPYIRNVFRLSYR